MHKPSLIRGGTTRSDLIEKLPASQKRRLERLDLLLTWDGSFSRSDLVEFFHISPPQASADISKYREIAPSGCSYDPTTKEYVRGDDFKPALVEPSSRRYLDQLFGVRMGILDAARAWFRTSPKFEVIPTFETEIEPLVLQRLLDAIKRNCGLRIEYQPLSRASSWRTIAPHALAFSGRRWHLRGWCFKDEEFREFVMTRILDAGDFKEINTGHDAASIEDLDTEWATMINVKIVPCRSLATEHQRVIAKDFNMTVNGQTITVRKPMVKFFVDTHRLDLRRFVMPDHERLIEIENWDEISEYVPEPREITSEIS